MKNLPAVGAFSQVLPAAIMSDKGTVFRMFSLAHTLGQASK